MRNPLRLIDLPPVWLAGFAAAAWGIGRLWPMPDVPAQELAGRGLVALGLLLMTAAVAQMVALKTTFIPRQDPTALVTGGVFRLSRNPIYLADAMVLAGLILHWSAWPALILVPAFAALVTRRFIRGEEARLDAAFGADYAAFRTRTRRWI